MRLTLVRSKNALTEASERQKNKRTTDAVGNVLLIPGLMSLAKDSREAVAHYKGEVETITLELDSRDCEHEELEEKDQSQEGTDEEEEIEEEQEESDSIDESDD